jgi:hypothetical protein
MGGANLPSYQVNLYENNANRCDVDFRPRIDRSSASF